MEKGFARTSLGSLTSILPVNVKHFPWEMDGAKNNVVVISNEHRAVLPSCSPELVNRNKKIAQSCTLKKLPHRATIPSGGIGIFFF